MENQRKDLTINISTSTIVKVLMVLVVISLIYLLKDVIILLIIAVVLASALNPWVGALQRRKVPRILSTIFIYLIFLGVFVLIIVLLIPPITKEIGDIAGNFPSYYNRVVNDFQRFREFSAQQTLLNNLESTLKSLQSNIGQTAAGAFSALVGVFGGLFSFVVILVITFYILLEENAMKQFIRSVTPLKYQPYVFQLVNRSQERLQMWLKGQLILCLIIGVFSYVGLLILGVKYSLVLGLWAGLTEFIPYIGPLLGGIPAVFIAITTGSILKGLLVVIWYFVIQQMENHLLVPKVMQKTVGLNPLIVIIVMLIGGKLAGIVGVILAIPITLIIKVFAEDFFALKEEGDDRLEA
jgi:predicted PurR-regulated permease PerM